LISDNSPIEKIKQTRRLIFTLERLGIIKRIDHVMATGYVSQFSYVGLKDCKDYVERLYNNNTLQREVDNVKK
jgi:hypothetical protein